MKKDQDFLGILDPADESVIARWLDDQFVFKGPVELIDGPAFKLVVSTLDNRFGEKIKEPYKSKLRQGIKIVLNEPNFEEASKKVTELLDEAIDIPYINDETEKLIFKGLHLIILAVAARVKPETV